MDDLSGKEPRLPYRTMQAIVLSRSDWRENDRILTMISPESGRMDALCRGCRKANSPLMPAAELFTMGEYVLFSGRGRELVHACTVIESFYPLRLDYGRLAHAAVMAAAALRASQPEEANPHLFILLARSLKRLAYSSVSPDAAACAFLLHFAGVTGFKPRLNHCVRCGGEMGSRGGSLLAEDGGVCCPDCEKNPAERVRLGYEELSFLREVLQRGIDRVDAFPARLPLRALRDYVEQKITGPLPRLPEG